MTTGRIVARKQTDFWHDSRENGSMTAERIAEKYGMTAEKYGMTKEKCGMTAHRNVA